MITLTPSQIQCSNRAQWIEHALDGIERFSAKSLTTDQKNGIAIQFGVLMDQLDVAVGALEKCAEYETLAGTELGAFCTGCTRGEIAHKSLSQMKSV